VKNWLDEIEFSSKTTKEMFFCSTLQPSSTITNAIFAGKAFRGLGDGEGILRFLCDKSQSVKRSLSDVVISELATALTSNVKVTVAFPS